MIIKVTEKNIKEGKPCQGHRCPVYLALKPFFKTTPFSVGHNYIHIYDVIYIRDTWIKLPLKAVTLIHEFDNYKAPKPIEFNISAECFMP